MFHRRSVAAIAALLFACAGAAPAAAQTRLLRFPDIHGEQIVFCYAGDLWLAPAAGGSATRLTAHPGLELFPKFSPDGRWIAFTGQYDGDEQVYIVPAAGGVPKQLTYYPARGPLAPRWGYDHQVYGWTHDGQAVLFRSMRASWNQAETRLYTVPRGGGLPVPLPMPVSGGGDFSPDGKSVVYSPTSRDFRTWKRYEGGWAQDLYIYDLATNDIAPVTQHPRTDRDPMWMGGRIFFASDRDGTLNLYAFDVASGDTRAMTNSRTYDVRWPSDDETGRIVYELNGELHVLDVQSGADRAVSIFVPNDGVAMRPSHITVDKLVEDVGLSPKGERVVAVARGDIFTLPIEKGPTRNLTATSGAHEKWARWSPDGKSIAFVSDRSGEDEIYLMSQDGKGEPQQLTHNGRVMRYAPEWSPDGKRLAFSDKDGKLFVLALESKGLQEIADDPHDQIRDYTWSPDGAYLAFSITQDTDFDRIHIWGAAEGRVHAVTDPLFHATNPAWDPSGDYLYYLSARDFQPQLAEFEWNYALDRELGIFALALRKDVAHPFPPESDEVTLEGDKKEDGAEADKKDKEKAKDKPKDKEKDKEAKVTKPVRIDFEGLAQRVARVPLAGDNYADLAAIEGHLVYLRRAAPFYGRDAAREPELRIYEFEERKETTLAEKVSGYVLSGDGKKLLARQDGDYKLYDASPKGKDSAKKVATKGMTADVVPAEEWAQIFDEVWRRFRDFFYVENMHGYDWDALGRQYRALLEHVGHRADLNYVIGEMIAELNVSHAYITGGDWQTPSRPQVALPGAAFELDARAGRYRIARIYPGQNEEDTYRSPLTEVGVDARVGDYVLAIDGEELQANDNPYRLLRHKADRPVTLTLNAQPNRSGARDVTFDPITSETSLMYLDMVTTNRQRVSDMTDGRVGYLHIPNMGAEGIREFIKHYYGQIRKEGLVVDVRSNGGGNVSQMIIERLRRELLGTRFSRNDTAANTYPATTFHGHMVCLLDENSSSDGDIFPHMFRQAELGPLIGKRSWGGVVGITNRGPLVDGGSVNVPEFGTNGADGQWVIEGRGVEPDIEVANDPKSVIAGRDPQLERGVEEVLRRMRATPKKLPPRPADPVRTKQMTNR